LIPGLGDSVAGNFPGEVPGDPAQHKDKRDTIWILIYGQRTDPEAVNCNVRSA
jgi:hypothetical protein